MKRTACILGVLCLVGPGVVGLCGCDDDPALDCETRADCANHGECVDGLCECDTGYQGTHCSGCNITGGYVSDDSGGCIPATCEDLDGDGFQGRDDAQCPLGTDHCDDNAQNWTVGGCANCVDGDGDGYGSMCDMGLDCDDTDAAVWDDCNTCIDNDGDGHGVNCSDGPDCNDNDDTVHRGCYEVWYWGDFDTNGTFEVARQFYPGATLSTLSLEGTDTSGPLGGVAVSPDGGHVVVAATDASGLAVLNLYSTDATGMPLTLAAATVAGQQIIQPSFSPDGSRVAFTWDADSASFGLYVVDVGGSVPLLVSPAPGAAGCDVTYYRWAPPQGASQHIAFVGDVDTDGYYALWGVEVTGASPMADAIVATAEATALGVAPLLGFDDADRVYFKSDFEEMGTYRIFRANLDGTGRDQVTGSALVNGNGEASVGAFGLNDAGTHLAFSADAPGVGLYQVYIIDLAVGTADRVSNVTSTSPPAGDALGPLFDSPIVWAPEDDYLAVVADWPADASDLDDAYALFVVPTLNNGGVRLLGMPDVTGQNVVEVAFTPSGEQLLARGDLTSDDNFELFLTENIWSVDVDPSTIRIEDVPTGGDVLGFQVVLVQ